MYIIGIFQALGIVLIDSIYNIYIRFNDLNYDINPFVFPLYYLIANSLAMMIFAGPGKFSYDTVKNLSTWIFGLGYLASFTVELYLIHYVSSTELAILLRLTVPICIILSFIHTKKQPNKYELSSTVITLAAVYVIFSLQNPAYIFNIALLCIILALLEVTGYFTPEHHSINDKAIKNTGIRGQMRVISFALFITSLSAFIAFLGFAIINQKYQLNYTFLTLDDFTNLPTLVSAIAFGFILAPFVRLFQWSASYKISSESVLSILSIVPILTFIAEFSLIKLNIMQSSYIFKQEHSLILFGLTTIMALQVIYTLYKRGYKNNQEPKPIELYHGCSINQQADRQIIRKTYSFYEKNLHKTAQELNIPEYVIKILLKSSKQYSLKPEISQHIHDIFRNKIFYLDQLTKLENRKGFEEYFALLRAESIDFSLYYMDLNGFKQINDKYGHNVGDEVLIGVAEKMAKYVKDKQAKAYRFGGDEFAIIIVEKASDKKIKNEIKELIEIPIEIKESKDIKHITPRISIGKSKVLKEKDVKIKDILQQADDEMYEEKVLSKES